MGIKNSDFQLSVTGSEVVAPALPLQDHWLPFSNLDLLLPPVDVSLFLCFTKPQNEQCNFEHKVGSFKKALAQALVSFYAFAGEVVMSSAGEPELLCNNRGVEFIEATAEVELRHLNLYEPDVSVEGKLVPKKKDGVLAVQVTELKCGAVMVGCTFDHRIADAYSANMFLLTLSHYSTATATATAPSFRRSVLLPRRPLSFPPSLHSLYTLFPPPPSPSTPNPDPLLSRIYRLSSPLLTRLQSLARNPKSQSKPTRIQTLSAFLWKLVTMHASKKGQNPDLVSKMGIVVDGRKRLCAATMESYFGNVLSIPFGGEKIIEIKENPLSWVVEKVNEFLKPGLTKEHFLGLIDWVETRRPKPCLARIYANGADDGPAFVVSSGMEFPVSKLDFGWGKAVFGSYHFPWGGNAGYVMPMPHPDGSGDWIVYMHLTEGQLDFIEDEAGDVFRPFKLD